MPSMSMYCKVDLWSLKSNSRRLLDFKPDFIPVSQERDTGINCVFFLFFLLYCVPLGGNLIRRNSLLVVLTLLVIPCTLLRILYTLRAILRILVAASYSAYSASHSLYSAGFCMYSAGHSVCSSSHSMC